MIPSVLTRKQTREFRADYMNEDGEPETMIATVRYEDECGNGHNSFVITSRVKYIGGQILWCFGGGSNHDEIAKRIPQLAPYIKWHLCSSDSPMHYIANTLYHVLAHGPTHAWVYFTGQADPLGIGGAAERLLGYEKAENARKAEGQPGYRLEWDEKTIKVANLDHARSSAIWSDATDDELTSPGLKERLEARLPALMQEFQAAVESFGFTF